MRIKLLTFLSCIFWGLSQAMAQTSTVTGVVISAEDNEPVIGASVLVQGTLLGAVTDNDGKFEIANVPNAAKTLKISYVGMESREVAIQRGTVIRISLKPDAEVMDEVMVVAYGVAKKSSFTGSVSTVSSKSIEKMQVSNVSKALEGSTPGVQVAMESGQPGSGATVRIRGIGSINSSSSPLYIVDGMPYDGNLSAINPADIESISVLKDAASTSLYGSRAANGVILITTKKGASQQPKVSFNARVGVNSRGISEYDIMKDPGEYMTTYWTMLRNQLGSGEQASAALYGRLGYNPYKCANDAIVDANGNLTTAELRYHDDWAREAMRDGIRQEYTLTAQGGSDKSTHFLSLGYLDDEGIISNSDYSRLSVRASGDYNVNKFIKLNGNIAYARGEQNNQTASGNAYANTFMFTQFVAPIYPVYAYDADGNRLYADDGSSIYDFGDGQYGVRAWASSLNPIATDKANQYRIISDNLTSRFGATISLLTDFKFQVNGSYDVTNESTNYFSTPLFGDDQAAGGTGMKYRTRTESTTVNELLTYTKTLNGKHNLDVMVGHENHKFTYNNLYAYKEKFLDAYTPEFNNAVTMRNMESYTDEYTIESYLGRVNYNYDDHYYFSGSIRRDGSSRFAKDHRWGTFWSLGGSWRITKEHFMEEVNWMDNLTLRASYGSVGNDDIYYPGESYSNYYPYKTQYRVEDSGGDFSVTKYYQGNADLTWETSYNFNLGVSATLFGSLLDVDIEYFSKRTEDMLYNMPQPSSSGVAYISENALTMTNKGFEFTLGVNVPMPKEMTWKWTFTGTHYRNKVTGIPESKRKEGITHNSYYNIREGKSTWDFYTYRFAGLDENGHSLWYYDTTDGSGNTVLGTTGDISKASKYFLGSALPDFLGGITTEFTWKGFDFSLSANYQLGGKIYDSMYRNLMHSGDDVGNNWHRDILNAWSETNPTSQIPVLDGDSDATNMSDRFLIGADYFNLRNITFGYTFPGKWLKAIAVENARVYFVADNVAIWSRRKGMDPRQYIQGCSDTNYSIIRSISVGLSLTL